jgi:sulfite exporter TauE/SafE
MNWIPFTLGLAGSLHCVGMCGPLQISTPKTGDSFTDSFYSILYHLGRISIYVLIGLLFGIIGNSLSNFELGFRLILFLIGLILILTIAAPNWLVKNPISYRLLQFIGEKSRFFWKRPSHLSSLALGALNGLLPCGMVYAAAAGSATTTSTQQAMEYMLFFGLGTWPLLFLTTVLGFQFYKTNIKKIQFLRPVMIGIMGVWLMLWSTVLFSTAQHHHNSETATNEVLCLPSEIRE